MPIQQPVVGREGLRLAGGPVEPVVSAETLLRAVSRESVESLRPLLPVGYTSVAEAYRGAAADLTAQDLTSHYTEGMSFFHETFVPYVKGLLQALSGGKWDLKDYVAYASGSDVDMMGHLIEGSASRGRVCLFPGDWMGFEAGCTHPESIHWSQDSAGSVACLCIPSVRNGHFTEPMLEFLRKAEVCLLNLNLFPTLLSQERLEVAESLGSVLEKSVLSISFSRGFGLTASQLGLILVHRDHPWVSRFDRQWKWFTYFYNALAARAFMRVDIQQLGEVDNQRREWVREWLLKNGLPAVESGSYYVKSFQVEGAIPQELKPLSRDNIVRFCFKPPQT